MDTYKGELNPVIAYELAKDRTVQFIGASDVAGLGKLGRTQTGIDALLIIDELSARLVDAYREIERLSSLTAPEPSQLTEDLMSLLERHGLLARVAVGGPK